MEPKPVEGEPETCLNLLLFGGGSSFGVLAWFSWKSVESRPHQTSKGRRSQEPSVSEGRAFVSEKVVTGTQAKPAKPPAIPRPTHSLRW